jgi:hypothetical protein
MAGTSRSIRRWPGPLYSVPALLFPANPVRPEAHLVLSTACSLQVRVSKRVSGRPTLCLCGQLSPLNAKIHWSTSTSIWFWGTRWEAARFFPTFYVEGGVRRLALDIHATVGSSIAIRSPGYWDPLIGLTYCRQLGRKWRILIHGDGGGFGVGSDVDVTATARAE